PADRVPLRPDHHRYPLPHQNLGLRWSTHGRAAARHHLHHPHRIRRHPVHGAVMDDGVDRRGRRGPAVVLPHLGEQHPRCRPESRAAGGAAMICQPPALADYTDTFDRADSSDLGADWRPEFGSMVIATNRAQSRSVPSNTARTGQWETYVGDYGGRLFTDNWEITAPLQPPVGTGSVANFSGVGMGMQDSGPAAGMVLVYAIGNRTTGTGSGGTRIMTYTGSGIA